MVRKRIAAAKRKQNANEVHQKMESLQRSGKPVPRTAEGPQAAEKGLIPEKRLFALPYISHNVHYTKYMQSKNKTALLFWF